MSFSISSEVDKNKVFLANVSDLKGRFDPHFYRPFFRHIVRSVNNSKPEKLGSIVQFSCECWNQKDLFDATFPYIEIGEIDLLTGEIKSIQSLKIKEAPSRAKMIVRNGDILVSTTRPSRGAISLVCADGVSIASTGFAVIRKVKNVDIDKHYLFYWLRQNCSLWQMEQRSSGGNYPAITQEELSRIKIPVPPKEIQYQVVSIMEAAYSAKRSKEEKAQKLLDGIDDYLLGELGIDFLERGENTLKSRIFTRRLSEVSGGRLDAPVHQNKYVLETAKYPMNRFGDCVFINPLVSFSGFSPDTQATFIPMEKISDEYGEADISEFRTLTESGGYTKFQDNDLLWAKITPCMQNGKSAIVSGLRNSIGFGSTEFHIFRAKSGTDIGYIYGLLRLHSLRNHAVLYFSGSAGHQRVSDEFFKKLNIPKPPLEKQTEIANHITEIRNQAKRLREQAKADLEQAKQEVETMILEW
ncbi:MAG: restriction endonuclease subunit S [Nitrospira sp.]|nr:restriction endonuclease subunit S [Nitrospira sp.]